MQEISPDKPADAAVQVPLWRLAHSRTGDKGDVSNMSLVAWSPEAYEVLVREVTEARVASWFAYRAPSRVTRYLLPGLQAMNLVIERALDGGVNDALNLDAHGKALSFHLLEMTVPVRPELAGRLPDLAPAPG
ncbi:hypothetical protein V8Z80_00420 [Orrella sp. JC864]|uniref:AtuA-related protein n=1 Tax=Orrella sp. JC864 TaxID=3120298 RepID=UPI0012BCB6B3